MWWNLFFRRFFKKPKEIERICFATVNEKKQVSFDSQLVKGSTLEQIIEDDKQYGKMKPKNGRYFTYRVMDWEGKWITNKQITRGVTLVWNKVEKVVNLEFRLAKEDEYADFKIYFKSVADDPLLKENTLMYHYYPISDFDNPHRGVCVVNSDYTLTTHGEGIPLHEYNPEHYPEPTTATKDTIDFDATYEHEGPGHGLGLPHSPNRDTKMYYNYSGMAESIFDEKPFETIARLRAKYDREEISESDLKRWIYWFNAAQDRR